MAEREIVAGARAPEGWEVAAQGWEAMDPPSLSGVRPSVRIIILMYVGRLGSPPLVLFLATITTRYRCRLVDMAYIHTRVADRPRQGRLD